MWLIQADRVTHGPGYCAEWLTVAHDKEWGADFIASYVSVFSEKHSDEWWRECETGKLVKREMRDWLSAERDKRIGNWFEPDDPTKPVLFNWRNPEGKEQ